MEEMVLQVLLERANTLYICYTPAQSVTRITPLQTMLLLILLGLLPVTTSGPSNMPPNSLTMS